MWNEPSDAFRDDLYATGVDDFGTMLGIVSYTLTLAGLEVVCDMEDKANA